MRLLAYLVLLAAPLAAQHAATPPPAELLWSSGAPWAVGYGEGDKPSLTTYLPASGGNGTSVIVCPGGGYRTLAMDHEGHDVARWLNSLGVAAFVLRYRLGPRYHHPIQLGDAQRAIRTVRSRAAAIGLDPARVGIMGFSAGGHLASTAATHFDAGDPGATDPIDRAGSRPDFAILGYPVISFTTEYTHRGSKQNLLGDNPDPARVNLLSNELQVSAQTPPAFLVHTSDDSSVPPENSVLFYMALRKHKVPAEMHIYEKGPHGVGLAATDATLGTWTHRLADWLRTRGLLGR